MSDTKAKNADVSAPSDAKTARARQMVEKWCELYGCKPGDIPERARKVKSRAGVGTLVYAIRKVADVDMFPAAELLGIDAAEVMVLGRDTRILIEEKSDSRACYRLDLLLGRPTIGRPPMLEELPNEERLARKSARAAEQTVLTERRKGWARKACKVMGMSFETAFDNERRAAKFVDIRSVAYAVVYALDEQKNLSEIADSFDVKYDTLVSSLDRVSRMLSANSQYEDPWLRKIGEVCEAFNIIPTQLMRRR